MVFVKENLYELADFLLAAPATIPYIEVSRNQSPAGSIALRHDVDHSILQALAFARWEESYDFRSTYYVLPTADYWTDKVVLYECINEIVSLGHEIGLHNDALCYTNGDVVEAANQIILWRQEIMENINFHYSILGIADHGGAPHTNGDIWDHYTPEALGFEYEAYQLQRSANTLISDNQGRWRAPLKHAQTFMLVHPIHWPI